MLAFVWTTAVGLAVLNAALVVVRAEGGQGCPSAAQVADAVEARMPGALIDASASGRPGVLVLTVSGVPGAPVAMLTDDDGAVRLRRALRPAASTAQGECAALADTVALILERFLDEVVIHERAGRREQDQASPLVAPAPWTLAVEAGLRSGGGGPGMAAAHVNVRRLLGSQRLLPFSPLLPFLQLRLGGQGPTSVTADPAGPQARFFPVELDFGLGVALRHAGNLAHAGLATAPSLLVVEESGPNSVTHTRFGQTVGIFAGYEMLLGPRWFVRVTADLRLALIRYRLGTLGVPTAAPLASTPRVFATLAVAFGIAF